MRKHTGEKPFKCAAIHVFGLQIHMGMHTREKPCKCEQCDYVSADDTKKTHDDNPYTREVFCLRMNKLAVPLQMLVI